MNLTPMGRALLEAYRHTAPDHVEWPAELAAAIGQALADIDKLVEISAQPEIEKREQILGHQIAEDWGIEELLRRAATPFVVEIDEAITDETVLLTLYSPYVSYRPEHRREGETPKSIGRPITAGQLRALAQAVARIP